MCWPHRVGVSVCHLAFIVIKFSAFLTCNSRKFLLSTLNSRPSSINVALIFRGYFESFHVQPLPDHNKSVPCGLTFINGTASCEQKWSVRGTGRIHLGPVPCEHSLLTLTRRHRPTALIQCRIQFKSTRD